LNNEVFDPCGSPAHTGEAFPTGAAFPLMKKARKPSKKLARRLSAQTGNAAIPRKGKREPIKTRGAEVNKESKSVKSENGLFPIVGVGASAGGLEAFTRLIKDLPADTGMAFVLVQHLDPEHESKLPQLLAKTSKMPVLEVANNTRVKQNHIYVIPPNRSMTINDRVLKLLPREQANERHRSIDHFFGSLANDQRHQAIGVILSGTATDGTFGLQAIKGEGGITFAQDESAKYDSMPRSAIAAGDVDFVLPPEKIAEEIARIAEHPYVATEGQTEKEVSLKAERERHVNDQDDLQRILLLLRNHSRVDFSLYRKNTIRRRIMRRMVLAKIKQLNGYANYLRRNTSELEALYQDLLIAVTSFFRNPEIFEALKKKVFPKLLNERSPDDTVRVWVIGCSTGQEAYSIAMAFLEYSSRISQNLRLQVFATDLNDVLLEKARAGLYSKSLVQDVSAERLRRFFVEEEGGYRVSKTIREMCIFARQDILTDPPFSRMDLISCRNLLIYLEPELQRRLMPNFHYALKPDGVLVLGLSESIGTFTSWFAPIDKKLKIFTKKPGKAQQLPHVQLAAGALPPRIVQDKILVETRDTLSTELAAQREADRIALARYGPPGVVINAGLEILQFRGDTSPYLAPPRGRASFDLLKMARERLMLPLRDAINKAKKENKRVRKENVRVDQNGSTYEIHLEVIPLKNVKELSFLVLFESAELPTAKRATTSPRKKPASKRDRQKESGETVRLERELAETRDYLQAVQEQYDAANEELQASAEEMQSANEELQSINEELETSKEELESTNEELTTVNEEMANRNAELTRLNSDMVNLQSSVNLAILLLGRDLSIRRFTQPAEKLFNLMATDVGRPISIARHNLEFPNLETIITEVIENVAAQEHEVRDKDGRWFLLRVRPYMTLDNKIDGAVLVLVDITTQKQAEEARRLASIVESSDDAIIGKDLDGVITSWNRAAEALFGYTAQEAIGKSIKTLFPPERMNEEVSILERISTGERIENYETVRLRKDGSPVDVSLTVSPIVDANGNIIGASKIARDISARKRAEQERAELLLREQNARAEAEAANRLKDEFLAVVSHEVRTPLNSIVGWIQMVRSGKLDEEHTAKALESIDRNAALQGTIITELLETSRIVTGNLKLDSKPIALPSLIEAAIEIVRPAAEAKSIQIETALDISAGPIWGDSGRLQQVFWNLLSNAVKFTPKGGRIDVHVERDNSNAIVVVKDNGEGIEADFLPYVFDRFRQADATTSRSFGGLGLGLSIVRSVVEMHGGSVRAESEGQRRGTTFTVTLPIMAVPDVIAEFEFQQTDLVETGLRTLSTPTRAEIVRLDGLHLLVVDDHEDTRELLRVALTNSGADVRTCASSADALASIKNWKPDCIISDVGMPGEDGYELIKKIRALKKKDRAKTPAIALTGFAGTDDKSKAIAAGYQLHLSKPVDLGTLTSEIARLAQRAQRQKAYE
jgi:two-component system CheB/CheR fusion protein